MAADPYQLWRFVDAQRGTIDRAIAELRDGRKKTHWMWFVFPQLAGLGRSPNAQFFAIGSLAEAAAYLSHPDLDARLGDALDAILAWSGRRTAEEILGPIDATKLRSSLTLFDVVAPNGRFADALAAFYGGERDQQTLALLDDKR